MSRPRGGARKASPKNSVKVEIAGERHILLSDAPVEYTHAVAAHVDGTIRAMAANGTLEQHRAAILAALVITDELFRTREELRALREEVDRRAALLADLLDRANGEERPVGE